MAGLSCSIAVLLEKLHSVLSLPGFKEKHKRSVSFLNKLTSALTSTRDVISDAEEKQLRDSAVKFWLEKVEDAVYDAEDVVDEILYEATRSKQEAGFLNVKSCGTDLNPASIKRSQRKSIREIVEVIGAIAAEKYKFELKAHDELPLSTSDRLPVTTSFVYESAIHGRREDQSNVVRLLLSGDENLDAIAIVGMGGLGKTALAQLVFNDENVRNHFVLRAWICVSFDFDVHRITRNILQAIEFGSFEGYGLNGLQRELAATIAGKRFLLVLDDVWNEDISKWNAVRDLLKSGERGSKIIVTTRNENVAAVMGCSPRIILRPLTEEDCWSILKDQAFAGTDKCETTTENIGRQIAKHCHGLPLYAREIGSLLCTKAPQEWRHVLNNLEIKSFGIETGRSMFQTLWLSYYHLPAQLKRCFFYCSLFPKGYEFDKEELVHLWTAEGFLQQSTTQSMEKVGAECFNDLLKRSFFIPGDNSRFKMHDLMHDLAEFVSQKVCFRLESNSTITESAKPKRTRHLLLLRSKHDSAAKSCVVLCAAIPKRTCHLSLLRSKHHSADKSSVILRAAIPKRTRHLSLLRRQHDSTDESSVILPDSADNVSFNLAKRLTSFYLINSPSGHGSCQLGPETLEVLFVRLRRLRVLSLPDFEHDELPASIGKLKYLRHLDFSGSALTTLPESLCSLYCLQTLILKNCFFLSLLPQGIVKLVQLQKLNIRGAGLKQMPEKMGSLTSLQYLTNFSVGHGGSSIRELGKLPRLRGSLCVSMLQNISSVSDASAANLKAMKYLDELELQWSSKFEDSATDHKEVLQNLKPSWELKKLSICFYGGTKFPNWLGDSSFLKITSLHLAGCRNCVELPPLGQLSLLEHLIIEGFRKIECIDQEFFRVDVSGCKPFQSLKTLEFREMPKWEKWLLPEGEGEEFPCLEEFYIIKCPKFVEGLPKSLPTLMVLEIAQCEKLAASFPRTSERCVLKLASFYMVQLEVIGTTEIQEEEGAIQEEPDPSRKYESSIGSYGDTKFHNRLEISTLSKITRLFISDNNNCSYLPPLGQLPLLEHLIIQRIGGVRSIGPEFYWMGLPVGKPFQSLKTLKFEAMSQWERWTLTEVEGEEFPCLQEFYIINCPKLEGDLPNFLPSLTKLEISECQQLAAFLPKTSERCEPKLKNCNKVQRRSNNNQTVAAQLSPSTSHPEQDGDQKISLSTEVGNQQFPSSSSKFSSIGTTPLMKLPTDLQSLRIERYASSELPEEILRTSSLQHLYIINCISLKNFPLSPSLKTLYIHSCRILELPQSKGVRNSVPLEDLCLGSSCDSLEIFPLNYFPKLKALSLWDLRNLEHLSIEKELQTELTSLDSLEIKDCPKFRSFVEEEFQAPNLKSLVFFNCGSLKSLQQMHSFKSLQSLYINKCPALESLPVEGLPSSLVIISVSFCDKITPQKGWKLDELHSLSHFEIEGECQELKSFPEEGLLPANLNSLRISGLLNLMSLDNEGLQRLTSLQTLEINCCNKLDSLPEHGLPSSLYSLSIADCSLLNPKLQNRKGKEWLKIARIPSIHLDEVSD